MVRRRIANFDISYIKILTFFVQYLHLPPSFIPYNYFQLQANKWTNDNKSIFLLHSKNLIQPKVTNLYSDVKQFSYNQLLCKH